MSTDTPQPRTDATQDTSDREIQSLSPPTSLPSTCSPSPSLPSLPSLAAGVEAGAGASTGKENAGSPLLSNALPSALTLFEFPTMVTASVEVKMQLFPEEAEEIKREEEEHAQKKAEEEQREEEEKEKRKQERKERRKREKKEKEKKEWQEEIKQTNAKYDMDAKINAKNGPINHSNTTGSRSSSRNSRRPSQHGSQGKRRASVRSRGQGRGQGQGKSSPAQQHQPLDQQPVNLRDIQRSRGATDIDGMEGEEETEEVVGSEMSMEAALALTTPLSLTGDEKTRDHDKNGDENGDYDDEDFDDDQAKAEEGEEEEEKKPLESESTKAKNDANDIDTDTDNSNNTASCVEDTNSDSENSATSIQKASTITTTHPKREEKREEKRERKKQPVLPRRGSYMQPTASSSMSSKTKANSRNPGMRKTNLSLAEASALMAVNNVRRQNKRKKILMLKKQEQELQGIETSGRGVNLHTGMTTCRDAVFLLLSRCTACVCVCVCIFVCG